MLTLSKLSETSSTITLGWTPPAGVDVYAFYAAGKRVSTGDSKNKDGTPRTSVKFSKTTPGPPFEVVAVMRRSEGFALEWGAYPSGSGGVFPANNLYPSETRP